MAKATKPQMPAIPAQNKIKNSEGSHVPSSISPTPGASPVGLAPGLDLPESLTPGFDKNPAGLSGNPHVEDPHAISNELGKDLLNDFEDESGLGTPDHKVKYETAETMNRSVVSVPNTPKGGIEVVATRDGFYNQERLKDGDHFVVSKFTDLGMWMVCTDPDMEKKRKQYFKDREMASRKKALQAKEEE